MIIRLIEQKKEGKELILKHEWITEKNIPDNMKLAVMASEDQNFKKHHGFDFNAIYDAAKENIEGKRYRGGSTISQQTAKNVFLWPGHSWLRKGLEVYFTILIELFWSKDRILTVYLNSIEMGNGIYGVKAISVENFNCLPLELSKKDCALIAATLPAPLKYSSKHPGPFIKKRQRWILNQMKMIKV